MSSIDKIVYIGSTRPGGRKKILKKMEKKYRKADECPISATIDVIGGKWKPIIIWVLMKGPKRFGELHTIISGIALKVLSRQLKELAEDGLIHREVFPEVPPRVEYSLTQKGEGLKPVMEALSKWSQENILEQA